MISLRKLGLKHGLSQSFFPMMKKDNKEKFNYVFSFDEDKEKSIEIYLNNTESLIRDMEKLLFKYERRSVELSRKVFEADVYDKVNDKNFRQIYHRLTLEIFKKRYHLFTIKPYQIKRWVKILEIMEEKDV